MGGEISRFSQREHEANTEIMKESLVHQRENQQHKQSLFDISSASSISYYDEQDQIQGIALGIDSKDIIEASKISLIQLNKLGDRISSRITKEIIN